MELHLARPVAPVLASTTIHKYEYRCSAPGKARSEIFALPYRDYIPYLLIDIDLFSRFSYLL
jgi:hypothetical protein